MKMILHKVIVIRKKSSFTRRSYSWSYFSLEIKDLNLSEQQMLR